MAKLLYEHPLSHRAVDRAFLLLNCELYDICAAFVQKNQSVPSVPFLETNLFSRSVIPFTMKLLSESIRNFCEGFLSFYTSFYDEMKRW